MSRILSALLLLLVPTAAWAQDDDPNPIRLRIAGWNMEGNGNDIDPQHLKSQLAAKEDIDIWGLSEVRPNLFNQFQQGAAMGEGQPFRSVNGNSGRDIRLQIIFDTSAVELLDSEELSSGSLFSNHRRPLVAHFRGRQTGQEFKFMVNHLARRNGSARRRQAEFLNEWAATQSLPVIAVGDYNMDFHLQDGDFGDRDPAFDEMIDDGHWEWLRPQTLQKTQASDRFRTVLDFVFVANVKELRDAGWMGRSRILNRAGDSVATEEDFDDSDRDTDHRPVDAILELRRSDTQPDPGEGEELTDRQILLQLLQELRAVRQALENR